MAVRFLTAYPYHLGFLCNVGNDLSSFHKNLIFPLVWYGFGSAKELLELPVSLLNRYIRMMEDEGMTEMYWSFKDPYFNRRR